MTIGPGSRVGPYEVNALIGEGGMGKVWRAHHTGLKRDDALKVLPDAFASDPDRLARFQREAQVLASLNHPNIAHVYGLEHTDGVQALVMELVEGPTLADRIVQGPIPVDEALPIAKQIAEALEAAHEQGIIHRDLKPANIKVRSDGTVKVLDFGLAKAMEPAIAGASVAALDVTASPTITSPAATRFGMILGTAAYMSPEQARGKAVDKRSDIWAFGCVLYEMLTGKRAFAGDEVSDVLASVLAREPDWMLLPPNLSPVLVTFLKRCLHKDRKQRIGDAQSLRLALEGVFETASADSARSTVVVQPLWRQALPFAVTAVVAALVAGVASWSLWPTTPPVTVNRFEYVLPGGQQFRNTGRPVVALSPDGRRFVYNATGGLYLRMMGELAARLVPSTEQVLTSPTFSPDGQSIAFYQDNQLKRIAISGGAPITICAATNPFGTSWERDSTILFGQPDGIMRVSANGGTPELVIRAEKNEQVHGPQMLPDGESVLFSVTRGTSDTTTRWDQADIVVQSLRTGQRTVVLSGGSDARYLSTGHLIYALDDGLFAAAFDANRREVRGGPVSLIKGVIRATSSGVNTAAANYGISSQGTLVYATSAGAQGQRTLVWVDRAGQENVIPAPLRAYQYPRVSPDGTRLALDIRDQEGDIWIWDVARQTLTRLTVSPGEDTYPVWSPDSQRLIFGASGSGPSNLYWQAADGTGAVERLTESRNTQVPHTITPDGAEILFREAVPGQQGGTSDLMRLPMSLPQRASPLSGSRTPRRLLQTMFDERNAELAPQGQWLAYESNESGRYEVYVRPFPNVESGRWQVSTSGGSMPVWARSGDELFYVALDGTVQGVRVEGSSSWRSSPPTKVLQGAYYLPAVAGGRTFDVAPDGKRFLMIKAGGGDAPAPEKLIIVENWFEELKRLVPTN